MKGQLLTRHQPNIMFEDKSLLKFVEAVSDYVENLQRSNHKLGDPTVIYSFILEIRQHQRLILSPRISPLKKLECIKSMTDILHLTEETIVEIRKRQDEIERLKKNLNNQMTPRCDTSHLGDIKT